MAGIEDANDKDPAMPGDITFTISAKEHMNPGDVADTLEKIAKVTSALLGRMLIANAFQNAGAAHPIAQQMFQCAGTASAAAMGINEQRRQLFSPGMMPGRGRA